MFKSYISVALRNLIKNRLYNGVNIGGLSVGLAACIMILLFVNHELSYDQWIPENDRVFRTEAEVNFEGGSEGISSSIPNVVGPLVKEQLDGIELSVRTINWSVAATIGIDAFEQNITLTDPDFFEMFGVELLEGSASTALSAPNNVILSKSDATRIFGSASPIGKVLRVDGQHDLVVTGVMPDWTHLSDLEIDAIAPISSPIIDDQPWIREEWGSFHGATYIRVREGVSLPDLTDSYNAFAQRTAPDWVYKVPAERGLPPVLTFFFRPAKDVHLYYDSVIGGSGGVDTLWSAAIVAALILAIAVMNVTNLGTMLALKRVREVTIRKALGANTVQLVLQILVESMLLTIFSLLLGLVFVELLLPTFGSLMDRALTTEPLFKATVIVPMIFAALLVGALSGLYPAVVAARFRPIDHLNGVAPTVGIRFRNILMIAQYAATIGLLITCTVVFQQALYAQSRDPGFESQQLVQISGIEKPAVWQREEALRKALARTPGVEEVAASHIAAGRDYTNNNTGTIEGGPNVQMRRIAVSENFFETIQVTPIVGRIFSIDRLSDYVPGFDGERAKPAVINKIAAQRLGFATPADAVGRLIDLGRPGQLEVVGIVNDLTMSSARAEVSPTYFWIEPLEFRHILVRISGNDIPEILAAIDKEWRSQFPDIPVQRQFVDEAFTEYYETERRRGWLLLGSAVVMIIVSTVGLFALSALTTERRAREIVIRKVLGARTRNIVNLLLWQFSKPIIAANLIAWPIVWFVMHDWLQSFTDRISLSPLPFLGGSMLVLLIAGITIIGQAIYIALSNPAKILRYE